MGPRPTVTEQGLWSCLRRLRLFHCLRLFRFLSWGWGGCGKLRTYRTRHRSDYVPWMTTVDFSCNFRKAQTWYVSYMGYYNYLFHPSQFLQLFLQFFMWNDCFYLVPSLWWNVLVSSRDPMGYLCPPYEVVCWLRYNGATDIN